MISLRVRYAGSLSDEVNLGSLLQVAIWLGLAANTMGIMNEGIEIRQDTPVQSAKSDNED
jgi:hypothetical protein